MSKKGGIQCEERDDGTRVCRPFRYDRRGNKRATGSEIEAFIDSETCKARVNVSSINEEDREIIARELIDMEKRCKKGF